MSANDRTQFSNGQFYHQNSPIKCYRLVCVCVCVCKKSDVIELCLPLQMELTLSLKRFNYHSLLPMKVKSMQQS